MNSLKPGEFFSIGKVVYWVCNCKGKGTPLNFGSDVKCFLCDMERPDFEATRHDAQALDSAACLACGHIFENLHCPYCDSLGKRPAANAK